MKKWKIGENEISTYTATSPQFYKTLNLDQVLSYFEMVQKEKFNKQMPIEFNIGFQLVK